jgi:DUF4097 and DUF4098 domain-containing protein YvlB
MASEPRDDDRERVEEERTGFSGFLRSLFSGIPWSDRAHVDEETTIAAPRSRRMDVHNANGKIRVIGEDRDDIHLLAQKRARAECSESAHELLAAIVIEPRVQQGVLELDVVVPRHWNRIGSADLELRVPRDLEVHAQTSNGKVCAQGLRCAFEAQSSNGSVRVDDVVGDVEVTTANAKVVCETTVGALVARSSNGKIQIGHHRGSLDASTSNGLIYAHLHEIAKDGVTLATSNGRIVLELPGEPDADVDVRVDNGVIRSDFALSGDGSDEAPGSRVRARLGRGGAPIRLRTSNGTISIREFSEELDADDAGEDETCRLRARRGRHKHGS